MVGTLADRPKQVARLRKGEEEIDVALMRLDGGFAKEQLKALSLASHPPKEFETVRVVGFPSTSAQQPNSLTVSTVNSGDGFFVLNAPVDHGYSGGVVLNDRGEAYGVISGVDAKQTTVLLLNDEMVSHVQWQQADQMLSRTLVNP